ncbi:MAG: hypothetical protein Q8P00_04090 [Dehalococcoidia bacterium]|nr:hypothetical protein [Dehalococcoidia bacterium]
MTGGPLQMVVFHDRTQEACDVACGMDWSMAENRRLAAERLEERFGSMVKINYVELSDPKASTEHREILNKVRREKLSTPLLVVNGKVRISGYFDIRMMVDMAEAGMEMGD